MLKSECNGESLNGMGRVEGLNRVICITGFYGSLMTHRGATAVERVCCISRN